MFMPSKVLSFVADMGASVGRACAGVSTNKARSAGRPTLSMARRGTSSRGKWRSTSGICANALCPCCSMAQATASSGLLAWNTPLTIKRWFDKPNSLNSLLVRAASNRALTSGRVMSSTLVCAGLLKAAKAWLKRVSCIFKPECGPRQDAPWSLPAKKPLHALGRLSKRKVWPLGAVSKITWS